MRALSSGAYRSESRSPYLSAHPRVIEAAQPHHSILMERNWDLRPPLRWVCFFFLRVPTSVFQVLRPMPPTDSEENIWFRAEILPHELFLRNWLLSRYANETEVDDIIQEAYLRIIQSKESGGMQAPKAYLFAIARNIAVNRLRRSKIVQFDSLTDFDISSVLDEETPALESISFNQELEMLNKAIESLPNRCRQIFTLRKLYSMPQPEIAKKLGISVNTVAAQLKIGYQKCVEFMESNGYR
jgi:RNA polymerase sigma factor (sigma-70 family)